MSEIKKANPDHPIRDELGRRWSPYVFDERPVATADLMALFEAARWAASSYNEQPWRYLVAVTGRYAEDCDLATMMHRPQHVAKCLRVSRHFHSHVKALGHAKFFHRVVD